MACPDRRPIVAAPYNIPDETTMPGNPSTDSNSAMSDQTVSVGVDRIELNGKGEFDRKLRERLDGLDYNSFINLEGLRMQKKYDYENHGRHGPDHFAYFLQHRGDFRLDVFNPFQAYALRIYLYRPFCNPEGLTKVRTFLDHIGYRYDSEQVSRLDLCGDAHIPFSEFERRLTQRCWVGRLIPNAGREYKTTKYFGKKDNLQLRVYDKAKQLKADGPLTRTEFEMNRHYLRKHGIETLGDINPPRLWRELMDSFRLTDKRPDLNHQHRFPNWEIWDRLRNAVWPFDSLLSREVSRRTTPHPRI